MLFRRCVWLLAVVGVALGVTAAAAQAHAALVATVPAAGVRVERAPAMVRLTFDDAVAIDPGSLRVLDANGRDVARGGAFRLGDGSVVAVRTDGLTRGSYVVSWHVVSDDGHVLSGAYAFGVGVAAGDVPEAVVKEQIPAAPVIRAVLHGLLLASIAIALGLLAAALLVARPGATIPPTLLEFAAWTTILFVAFFDIFVQADTSGLKLGAVIATRYGISRLVMMVATIVGLVGFTSSRRRLYFLLAAGAAIAIAEAVSGHAGTGALPLATSIAALAHLLGASIWIGLLLATAKWPERVDIERVSRTAAWCVFTIVASAVPQAVQGIPSFDALVTTTYGLLVCAKFVLLLLALAFAVLSRRRIAAGASAAVPTVRLELLVLTAILAVTAVLVESPQPRAPLRGGRQSKVAILPLHHIRRTEVLLGDIAQVDRRFVPDC
jgi:copper transport protein